MRFLHLFYVPLNLNNVKSFTFKTTYAKGKAFNFFITSKHINIYAYFTQITGELSMRKIKSVLVIYPWNKFLNAVFLQNFKYIFAAERVWRNPSTACKLSIGMLLVCFKTSIFLSVDYIISVYKVESEKLFSIPFSVLVRSKILAESRTDDEKRQSCVKMNYFLTFFHSLIGNSLCFYCFIIFTSLLLLLISYL